MHKASIHNSALNFAYIANKFQLLISFENSRDQCFKTKTKTKTSSAKTKITEFRSRGLQDWHMIGLDDWNHRHNNAVHISSSRSQSSGIVTSIHSVQSQSVIFTRTHNDTYDVHVTRTTNFLPHHITTVARTGRRISFIFFWRRPL